MWINARARQVVFGSPHAAVLTSGETVHARWLVLANGSPSWAARVTRQKMRTYDFLAAFWTHLPTTTQARLLFLESVDSGWWYLCPDHERGTVACFVTGAAQARRLHPGKISNWIVLFRATEISQHMASDASALRVHVAPAAVADLPRQYGSQWIAAGDAAARLDPLSSSGTAAAIGSGIDAAQAVGEMFAGDPEALERYARRRQSLFIEFTRQRTQQYILGGSAHAGDFWPGRIMNPSLPA
jgi:flavin-dependent dehydrogenase